MTELEILKKKCLDVHGEPTDGTTHGELERIKYLESQMKVKKKGDSVNAKTDAN